MRVYVGGVAKRIEKDALVTGLVGTGEFNEVIGVGGSSLVTAHVDLETTWVELGVTGRQMQGDDLVTDEISTMSKLGRKFKRMGLFMNCEGLF